MCFVVPNGEKVLFIMDKMINKPSEVAQYYQMLVNAGVDPSLLEIRVLTNRGLVAYDQIQPEDLVGKEVSEDMRLYYLHYLLANEGTKEYPNATFNPNLHTMMQTENMLGISNDKWVALGVNMFGANTAGLDKALVRVMMETDPATRDLISPGVVLFHPKKVDQAQERLKGADFSNAKVLNISSPEEMVTQVMDEIEMALSLFDNFVVVKYAAGHSGVKNIFINLNKKRLSDPTYDFRKDEEIVDFLIKAMEDNESFVIEQGYELLRDKDSDPKSKSVEVGIRGYITKEGEIVLTSVHRQQTTEVEDKTGGVYEGQILAQNAANLSLNPRFNQSVLQSMDDFKVMCECLLNNGYYGVVNFDYIFDPQGNSKAVDLNNLREGGSSATSNMLALWIEAIKKGVTPVIVSELEGRDLTVEDLGLWDKDYFLEGQYFGHEDELISELQSIGIYPYSTSTLSLPNKDANGVLTAKFKLAVPFNFRVLFNMEDSGDWDSIDTIILKRANEVLEKYGLKLKNAHTKNN